MCAREAPWGQPEGAEVRQRDVINYYQLHVRERNVNLEAGSRAQVGDVARPSAVSTRAYIEDQLCVA